MKSLIKRVPTGIPGFDKLIDGGFPENFVVLLAGTPGTGKSIFSLEYIYNGATKFDENGIYITLEQPVDDLKKQALMFGMDFDKLESEGKVIIEGVEELGVEVTIKRIKKLIQQIGAKRLVVDSLSGMQALLSIHRELLAQVGGSFSFTSDTPIRIIPDKESLRKIIWDIFMNFKKLNCTTLIPSEIPVGTEFLSPDGVSEFACDGIIELRMVPVLKVVKRRLTVRKMRQTKMDPISRDFDFEDDGIVVEE